MAALIALLPTAVALSLLVFGLGGHEPNLPRVLWLLAAAMLLGPCLVAIFGFVAWLAMVAATAIALRLYAATRPQARRPLRG
jgi:uncharacterized protein involved in exopolysaccharide biosynthesis